MDIPFMWGFAKKNLIRTFVLSALVVGLYQLACFKFLAIPFLPIASIGTAVAFYVGFKIIKPMIVYGRRDVCGEALPIQVEPWLHCLYL